MAKPNRRNAAPPAAPELQLPEDRAPVLYTRSYADEARGLCARGAGEADLAAHFRTDIWTIKLWKVTHPEFLSAVKLGMEAANERGKMAVYERMIGYTYDAVKPMVVAGELVMVPVMEHVPPDMVAAKFWLTNNDSKHWKDRVEQTVHHADLEEMSDDELIRIARGRSGEGAGQARGPRGPGSVH
jgi:hypothetical protein